jgi:hypothetical protein
VTKTYSAERNCRRLLPIRGKKHSTKNKSKDEEIGLALFVAWSQRHFLLVHPKIFLAIWMLTGRYVLSVFVMLVFAHNIFLCSGSLRITGCQEIHQYL